MTKVVAVDEAQLTQILEDVENDVEVVITRDGRPVARVVPVEHPLRGPMYGTVTFHGDIVETPGDDWKAER